LVALTALAGVIAAALLTAPAAVARSATAGQHSDYQVHVDIDGDGATDSLTVSASATGNRTTIRFEGADGGSAFVSVPYRGDGSVTAGQRLAGVAAITGIDSRELVVLTRRGLCSRYRVLRWARDRFVGVPSPRGGDAWRVCGLGVAQVGVGYRSAHRSGSAWLIVFRGRTEGRRVDMRRSRYSWASDQWRAGRDRRMLLRPAEALPLWGLDLVWRTN
jgi:hypothetical protein